MATGQPFLHTWRQSDNTARLFEFSPVSGFVQVATVGLTNTQGVSPPPSLEFVRDSGFIVTMGYQSNWIVNSRDIDLADNGSVTLHFDNGSYCVGKAGKLTGTLFTINKGIAPQYGVAINYTSGGLGSPYAASSYSEATNNTLAIHPQETCIFYAADPNKSVFALKSGEVTSAGHTVPVFNTRTTISNPSKLVQAEWANSGSYLFALGDDRRFYSYTLDEDGEGITLAFDTIIPGDVSGKLAIRGDDRFIAISTQVGADWTTYIYRRLGYTMRLFQTIANFGKLLKWTSDTSMLIDSGSKRLFEYDAGTDTFVENSTLIANLPAGVEQDAISTHIPQIRSYGFTYQEAVRRIAESAVNIDIANLKLMLLDNTAIFDASETDMSVLPDSEVSGQGWPVGGKSLANTSIGDNTDGIASLLADDVTQILIGSLTFRYAVIYDVTNSLPVAFLDFAGDVTNEPDITIRFNLSQFGALSFVS